MYEPEQKYRDMEQCNMFREMQVLGCGWSTDACLVGVGGEDGNLNNWVQP